MYLINPLTLDNLWRRCISISGLWQPGLARLHGVQEVGGSNPLAPTKDVLGSHSCCIRHLWLLKQSERKDHR